MFKLELRHSSHGCVSSLGSALLAEWLVKFNYNFACI